MFWIFTIVLTHDSCLLFIDYKLCSFLYLKWLYECNSCFFLHVHIDINECRLLWPDNQCNSAFGECVNLEGTHDCKCNVGFHQNNGSIACEGLSCFY